MKLKNKPEFNQNLNWENVQNRINFALKKEKLNQPILKELNESNLPILKWKNENNLTETEIRYLFYRQSRSNFIFPELELKPILEHIDLKSSKEFGVALWEIFLNLEYKHNFLLVLSAIFAEDHLIEPIFNQISTLIEDKKAKKTDELILALGLIATPKALRILDNFARKYKSKYKNIGENALKTLENIAFDKNLTEFELADYLIPNFGFNEAYEVFKVNDKKYLIIVDSNLDLVFMEDNGRKLKKLPLGADNEIVARVKEINKEIKDSIPALKHRMETYMIHERKWNFPEWKKVYVNNPIIFPFLNSLIWGVFENNQLIQTFITSESFMNSEYNSIEIFENQQVGIIHPAILNVDQLINWQSYINDNVTLQPFDQVFRKAVICENEKSETKYDISYSKLKFESMKFTRSLESRGWEKGSTRKGYIYSYFKVFKEQNIAAFINLSGYFKGYFDEDEYGDSGIKALYFVKPDSVKIDSYLESEPDNIYDERLIPFGKISKVIYSEILRDINYFISKD